MEPNTVVATDLETIERSEKDKASSVSNNAVAGNTDDRTSAKRPFKASDKNSSFIEKLWEVLNTPEYREAVHWSKDGQSFRIEPKMFYETSLNTKEFQGCKFESFLRRLLRWNFERVILEDEFPINAFVYQHASFKADAPELIAQLHPPKGAKTDAKKPRKKQKKSVNEAPPPASPSAPPPASPQSTRNEEAKVASPCNALDATQQGIMSQLLARREAVAASAFSGASSGLDRNSLLHSLGSSTSDSFGLLLQQRNHLADIVSSSLNRSAAGERSLLAQQLLAQQEEDALLVSMLQQRSQMQHDALLRSNHLLSNSAAAMALAPSINLPSTSRFLAEHASPSRLTRNLLPPSFLHERRESQPLPPSTILDAFRRGQLTVDEAEMLLRHLSQSTLDRSSRFLPPR